MEKEGRTGFIGYLNAARLRHVVIAGLSFFIALLFAVLIRPEEVGAFAYYAIVALLSCNALLTLLHARRVIRPITLLIERMDEIAAQLDRDDAAPLDRLGYDESNAFTYLAAKVDDLVERIGSRATVEAERAAHYKALVDAVPFGLFTLSRKGIVTSIVKQPALGGGNLRSFVVGERPDVRIWGHEYLAHLDRALTATFADGGAQVIDVYVKGPDDKPHHYRAATLRGDAHFALLTMCDVTALDARHQARLAKNKQEAEERRWNALSRFASGIGHDVKNVFTILSNLAQTYLADETVAQKSKQDLVVARDAIARGTALARELTFFAGETKYHFTRLPGRAFYAKFVNDDALRAFVPPEVELEIEEPTGALPEVELDVDQFWKVPMNLVKNAVEALDGAGGRIRIATRLYEMDAENAETFMGMHRFKPGLGILGTVTDDGPGIPAEMMATLFDPFVSSKGDGRGMGLCTVKQIVDAHGGGLRLRSERGRGTTVEIFLPAAKRAEDEGDLMREVAPGGEILLVDDDAAILRTTRILLQAIKVAAHPSDNAADAIHKFRTLGKRLKAVVLDAHLQGEISTGLLRRFRADDPTIPVIVVSALPEREIAKLFTAVPYDRFLEKPYTAGEINRLLANL